MSTINCNGKLVDLSSPKVMGILNVTPDSFYDGGNYSGDGTLLLQVEKMLLEGADFIDIGGQSSRPNAKRISPDEEIKRVVPPIQSILKEFPDVLISIDTFYSEVAKSTINEGVCIVNDVSAGSIDEQMFETVGELNVSYVLMHMQGTPDTMQEKPKYKDVVEDVIYFLSKKIAELKIFGVNDIIVDPGFGFGKTIDDNYAILNNIDFFSVLDLPILIGVSRKKMIQQLLDVTSNEALNGTSIANTIALQKGASILRVHDVKQAKECIKMTTFASKL